MLAAEDEVVAKVLVTHGGVLGKFLTRALEQDFALKQQIGPVGDAQRLGSYEETHHGRQWTFR